MDGNNTFNRPPDGNTREFIYCRTCFNWIFIDELMIPPHAGWRFSRGWVYCPECRSKGRGGKNVVQVDGIWYTEKEYHKFIKDRSDAETLEYMKNDNSI